MEEYRAMRVLFPQLPGEIWQIIEWYLLQLIMKEKLERCLPLEKNLDMFEMLYNDDGEWIDHQHTTSICNEGSDSIVYYHHLFRTDCCSYLDDFDEQDETIDLETVTFYRTQTFCLLKKIGNGQYLKTYTLKHYEDGHVVLFATHLEN
jgi:hypothetical protein